MELNFFADLFFNGAPLLWPLLLCLLLVLALVFERRWRLLTVLGEPEAGAIALLRRGSGVLMVLTVLAGPTAVVAQSPPQTPNRPPLIAGPSMVSVWFAENDTVQVSTFTATDPDGDGITWVLAGGDAGAFRVGASSGVLQFASVPNYEASADTDADKVYAVWVIAQDDGTPSQADSVSVAVTVTDVDEPGTLTLSSASPQVGVAMTATLTDEDEPVSKVRWTWQRRVDASADWVAIPSSGAASYTPVRADVGYQLRAKVKYNDRWGTDKKVTKKAPQQVVDVPGPPALSAESGDGQVALRWTAPTSDGGRSITGYEYWYSGVGDDAWSPVDGGASADNLTVRSLTNGQEYTFAVRAVNELGAGLADSTQATPQASNRPPLIGGPASVSVSFAENDTVQVSTFTATDPEGDGIGWVLAGDDASAFTLGASSGVLQFASAPNYEVPSDTDADNVYGVWVIVQDDGTPSQADSVSVAVTVSDGDDLGTLTLSSSSPQVGVAVTATLADEDGSVSKIRWTWQRRVDVSSAWVDIPSSSADSYTPVRADVGYQLRAKVKYNDPWGKDKKVTKKAPQQVVGVPGPPALSAEPGDGQVGLRWTAPTSDGGRPITGYEYWYSQEGGFAWSSVDGGASADNLTVRSLTNGQEYTFAVRAVNKLGAGLADSTQATPQASNRPPLIGGPASVSVSFAENDTVQVSTFTATDPEGDGIAWVLAGDDASAFTLEASSGVLQFASTPNYEAPSDTDADNVYQVWVIAQDDGTPSEADSVSVAVTVADGDDLGTLTLTLSSSSPQVGVALTATLADEDGQVSKIRWTWQRRVDASADWADIPSSGADSYTPVRADVGYQLRAKVKYNDRWGVDKKVTQKAPQQVVDVPGPPALSAEPGDGQVRLHWTAPASDGGRPITGYEYWYSQEGGFAWSSVDGGASADSLTVVGLTNGQEYTFAVRAVNELGAGLADSTQATPQVPNHPPSIGGPATVSVSFAENDTVQVSTFTATDPEGDGIAWVLAGDDASAFRVGASSGVLQFDPAPNYEAPSDTDADNVYQVWVIAQDDGTPSEADSVAVAVTVTAVDEPGTLTLSSSSPQEGVPLTVTLHDEDGLLSVQFTRLGIYHADASTAANSGTPVTDSGVPVSTNSPDTVYVFIPDAVWVGFKVQVRVTYTDPHGAKYKSTPWTEPVLGTTVEDTGTVSLSSMSPQVRMPLTATLTDSSGGVHYKKWTWQRRSGSLASWADIPSSSDLSYTPVDGDVGYQLRATVRYRDGHGAALDSAQSAATAGVQANVPCAPELSATPGHAQVTLRWTVAASCDGGSSITHYQYQQSAGRWTEVPSGGSKRDHVVSGLTNGTLYTFAVRAVNAVGAGAASNDASATPETAGTVSLTSTSPRVGMALTATLTDPDGQVTGVHWTWQRRSDSSSAWADISSSNAASYTPVVGDVGYQLRATVRYRDGQGNNQDSAQSAATNPVQGVPSAPRNLQASAQSSSQIRLTWDAPLSNGGATITGYQYRQQRQGGSWTEWSNVSGGGSARSRTVSGLSSSTSYTFQVRAVNKVGNGATAQATGTTQAEPPPPPDPSVCSPRNLKSTAYRGQVILTWDAPSPNSSCLKPTRYSYRWQRSGGSWTSWTDVLSSGLSVTVSGLSDNTRYNFQVRARNGDEKSGVLQSTASTPRPLCAPSLSAGGLGDTEIQLTWDEPSCTAGPITAYEYRYRSSLGTSWTAWSSVGDGSVRSLTVSGLNSGTNYIFQVRARDLFGPGSSATASATTRAGKPVVPSLSAVPDSMLEAIFVPNPFNPSTTLHVQIPTSGPVSLILYNLSGQVVRSPWVNHNLPAGMHQWRWDGRDDQGRLVASGVYLYVLRAGDQTLRQKITLLR